MITRSDAVFTWYTAQITLATSHGFYVIVRSLVAKIYLARETRAKERSLKSATALIATNLSRCHRTPLKL